MADQERTRDLYLQHKPPIFCFEATVVAKTTWNDLPSLVLDRTAFYPESGGQLADRGKLGPHVVIDVQLDDQGVIHHILQGSSPDVGCVVQGRIDLPRRRLHMAQHTGQHLLSQVLLRYQRAPTRSSRLGESVCTIDVDCRSLSASDGYIIEKQVNELIAEDLPVDVSYPERAHLDRLNLRRTPKVTKDIRVVAIGDFDLTPCAGTHCQQTSQIGLLLILGLENYKGMTRIRFQAGQVARALACEHAQLLAELSHEFSCSAQLVPKAVSKLQKRLGTLNNQIDLMRTKLAEQWACRLLQVSSPVVCAHLGEADGELLRDVSNFVCAQPGRVAVLAGQQNNLVKLVFRSSTKDIIDCGGLMRDLCKQGWARGGGGALYAEGVLTPNQNWNQLVKTMGWECSQAN